MSKNVVSSGMKLLFVYRFCGLGGVETSILNKMKALRQQGIETHALFSEFYGSGGSLLANQRNVTVGFDKLKVQDFLSQGYLISVIDNPWFLETLDDLQHDGTVLFETHASFSPALEYFYSQLDHPRIAAIVAPSEFNKQLIVSATKTSKDIIVIPNPIDVKVFLSRSLTQLKSRFENLANGPVILWVGRLEDQKNPVEFINIAQSVIESRKDARCVIVGNTLDDSQYAEYKERLTQLIKREFTDRFTFHPYINYEEMPYLYSLAAETGGCLVSTSLNESAPMTFIEAMACKCPVVSTDIGGVRELIAHGSSGLLYDTGDVRMASRAVLDLMNPEKKYARRRIIHNAFTEVTFSHSLEVVGKKYKAALEPLAEENRRLSLLHAKVAGPPIVPGLVSIIIPVYNRAVLLKEAVKSVLSQTYQNLEIIIVDDGSTDDTREVCDRLAAQNSVIRVLHLEHQGRPGLVREAGRTNARGEYIQYLDSDDLLLPTKFEKMVAALETNPHCDIAYCYSRSYHRGETPIDVPSELTSETFQTMLPEFIGRRFWHTSTPLYRRSLCDRVGSWSDLPFWEDIEYDIRIAMLNPQLYHVKEFLTDFRDHAMGRLSTNGFYNDPQRLAYAAKACESIYQHAKDYGISRDDQNLQFFIDDVILIHKRCKELGLEKEAGQCGDIVKDARGYESLEPIGDIAIYALIEPQISVLRARPGEALRCPIRVVNQSMFSFRQGEFAVKLSYHLLSVDGTLILFDNPRTLFDQPLRPGEARVIDLFVRAPNEKGLYYLEIDIAWGPITWLKWQGNPVPIIKLVVGETIYESKRWLQTYSDSAAHLTFPKAPPERVRIDISKCATNVPWHVQWNEARFPLRKNHRYAVAFRGRADAARSIKVAVSKAQPPWDGLGLYDTVDLTETWQDFEKEFDATADDDNARIHFDVGGSNIAVELQLVHLRSVPDGASIEASPFSFLSRLQMDIGVEPLSEVWGTDRGFPIHRYYLEQFLQEMSGDIRGRCLEFQDPQYAWHLGGSAVSTLDILHVERSNPNATLIADLTKPNDLLSDQFDCIICTHVLHVIFDVQRAVAELYRILKPHGVLLVAVPQASMCDQNYHEFWRFTTEGLESLLKREFGEGNVLVKGYGNSLTAAAELRGMVIQDFLKSEVDHHDPRFAVEVCARAIKSNNQKVAKKQSAS